MTPHWIRRLATLANERAKAYREPFEGMEGLERQRVFTDSSSYPIYSVLKELHLLLNKLADEMDAAEVAEEKEHRRIINELET